MMRPLRILAALMILAGAALLVYAIAVGEMQVALLLIVPVIYGSSSLGILAISLVIVGIFVAMADSYLGAGKEESQEGLPNEEGRPKTDRRTEFGGVVFIGPIPILFGSNRRMTIFVAVLAAIVLAVMLLSLFYIRG
jgi:uncharacterized protein (TIGR00304 family)